MTTTDAIQKLEQLPPPTPMELLNRAVQSNAQVDVMEKLMGLEERYQKNEARKAFDMAVSKAKSEIPIIRKGNVVDFTSAKGRTHYQYEDLASIAATIDPILSKHGLSYRWRPNSDAKSVTVTCILSHSAGHSEENTLYAPHDLSGNKNPIQAVGSAVTYLQRYTLKAALGLAAAADDDARAVSNQPAPQQTEPGVSFKVAPPTTKSAEAQQPQGETSSIGKILMVTEKKSPPGTAKPWTVYFILWESQEGAKSECGTFDKNLAEEAGRISEEGCLAQITTKPGKKPGTRELVNLVAVDPDSTPEPEPMGD